MDWSRPEIISALVLVVSAPDFGVSAPLQAGAREEVL
jgi:hypothetical protein